MADKKLDWAKHAGGASHCKDVRFCVVGPTQSGTPGKA